MSPQGALKRYSEAGKVPLTKKNVYIFIPISSCSYVVGYLQKGNTYETHNLNNQNLPIIASILYIISFLNTVSLSCFLTLLSIKHNHTINTIDIRITFRHDLVH